MGWAALAGKEEKEGVRLQKEKAGHWEKRKKGQKREGGQIRVWFCFKNLSPLFKKMF
jgi:hypothetical protein